MVKKSETRIKIPVDSLVKGLYVDLELTWNEHPFMFSHFKIKSDKDLFTIRGLGLSDITVIPEKSDVSVPSNLIVAVSTQTEVKTDQLVEEQQAHINQAKDFKTKHREVAKRYKEQARKVKKIVGELRSQPANAIQNVDKVAESLASNFIGDNDLVTNIVNLGGGEHSTYHHAVNVTMLSLMLGNAEKLSTKSLQELAKGALLHDLGKIEISNSITMKKEALSKAEAGVLERHTLLGRKLAERVRDLPESVLDILSMHHEFIDGSGYPSGLPGTKIPELVRIVSVANVYDNLCNPVNPKDAVTPKTAMATMFSRYKDKLDRELVERFIHLLGVYPPGTIVKLNDDSVGLVIASNSTASLKPEVLIYNPDIPKEKAIIVDLMMSGDLSIVDVIKPGDYPASIYEYLGVQERLGYLIESSS